MKALEEAAALSAPYKKWILCYKREPQKTSTPRIHFFTTTCELFCFPWLFSTRFRFWAL